ncbi:TIGR02391 family protein [Actinoplanes sp. NPDC049316]|uniref:TIGR02391 family protein n=1 Tax=Actinoplanes sp. NPDC049316 TaxID=3154727 RepID=UPI00341C3130
MEARKNPDYLRSLADAVLEFRDAFADFLKLHVPNGEPGKLGSGLAVGVAPAVWLRKDVSPEAVDEARQRVARAAGRAAAATPLTGIAVSVQGLRGAVDPITNWLTVSRPKPLLEPVDILNAADYAIARLEGLALEAEASRPPTIGAEAMHPTVWGAAKRLWEDGHYRQAVAAACESLVSVVKARTGRRDIPDTSLWQQVFSDKDPQPGMPRLRWPGNSTDQDVISMNGGLRQFAPGVQMTVRNSTAHGIGEIGEQEALERLAVLSLLARWLDECDLVEVRSAE